LTKELVKTGKFSTEEAGSFLKEAVTEGVLYRDEDGFYAIH
jgi:polyhydroxyalkanoate synthesis regulator phasin